MSYLAFGVPRTGLEPARLSALAPETSASTIPPPGLRLLDCGAKVVVFCEISDIFRRNFVIFVENCVLK